MSQVDIRMATSRKAELCFAPNQKLILLTARDRPLFCRHPHKDRCRACSASVKKRPLGQTMALVASASEVGGDGSDLSSLIMVIT